MPFKDPEARKAYMRAYDEARRDRHRAYNRQRYLQDPETFKSYQLKYRTENKGALRAKRSANPERVREISARRRARILETAVEPIDFGLILRDSGGICGICRQVFDLFGIEFDHIIPLARGGTHTAENIQATHSRCNRAKGAKVG